jgi:hypothetical protein
MEVELSWNSITTPTSGTRCTCPRSGVMGRAARLWTSLIASPIRRRRLTRSTCAKIDYPLSLINVGLLIQPSLDPSQGLRHAMNLPLGSNIPQVILKSTTNYGGSKAALSSVTASFGRSPAIHGLSLRLHLRMLNTPLRFADDTVTMVA